MRQQADARNNFPPVNPATEEGRLRVGGAYRELLSFQMATVVYDATVAFCSRFLQSRTRTVDQMVQAARSGRQNIAEGSRASGASSQTELRLVNVARASLEELLLDYQDFLRQNRFPLWDKSAPEALEVREMARSAPGGKVSHYNKWLSQNDPAVVPNTIICLIHQTNYLLDRQITSLERDFVQGGGYTERLAAARIQERERQRAEEAKPSTPVCPVCGKPMVLRTARKGKAAGSQFWGCSGFPECKGTRAWTGDAPEG
jgi:four helix bundle suffix protein